MKWRIFITFEIVCYICIYALWAYSEFGSKGPPAGSPDYDAWKPRGILLAIMYSFSIIKALADCVLFY